MQENEQYDIIYVSNDEIWAGDVHYYAFFTYLKEVLDVMTPLSLIMRNKPVKWWKRHDLSAQITLIG